MITPDLIKYIEEQVKKNTAKDIIISKLTSSGWHREDIDEGLKKVTSLESTVITPPTPKIPDPYREPTVEIKSYRIPVSVVKDIQPEKVVQEIPKEDFIPTLKPKETMQTTFKPVVPISAISNIPLKNIPTLDTSRISPPYVGQYKTPIKPAPVKVTGGVPKIAIWIFVVFVLGVLAGGAVFAFNKGLINIPGVSNKTPIGIPFIKSSPEKIIEKALALSGDMKRDHIEGLFSIAFKENPRANFEGQFKFVDGVVYLNSRELITSLGDSSLDPSMWISFDTKNIPIIENTNYDVQLLEKRLNGAILDMSKYSTMSEESIKNPSTNIKNFFQYKKEETQNEKILSLFEFPAGQDTAGNIWIDNETFLVKKFELYLSNNYIGITTTFIPFDLSQIPQIVAPSGSRSFHELVAELSIKAELKSKDMVLKNSLDSLAIEIEAYKNTYKSYGKTNTGNCSKPAISSVFYVSATNKKAQTINDIVKLILGTTNNQGACYSTDKAWAVAFPLFSNPNIYYCADSTGAGQEITVPLTKTSCQQVETVKPTGLQ